jgi:hypothetical protein
MFPSSYEIMYDFDFPITEVSFDNLTRGLLRRFFHSIVVLLSFIFKYFVEKYKYIVPHQIFTHSFSIHSIVVVI